jgi:elongation factor 1 alpha-like protein
MSKKGKFYDEDDCYDEDYEDYGDEGYEDYNQAKPSVNSQPASTSHGPRTQTASQLAAGKGGFGHAPMSSPGSAKKNIEHDMMVNAAEQEILNLVMPNVKAVMGTMVSDSAIVQALRKANYNPDEAVDLLLTMGADSQTVSPATSPPPPVASTSTSASSSMTFGTKKKGSKLVLGASPAPQQQEPDRTGPAGVSPAPSGAGSPRLKSCQASPTVGASAYFPSVEDKKASDVKDNDGKQAIALVMAGHVDTGKSTILGHLLVKLGVYSDRDVAKLELQAKREGKASFHFAWLNDQSKAERQRGITIDAGVQDFETDHRRVMVLDAPGHKDYVTAMITSAAQADLALFTISAAPGEFESGLAHMTKEHLSVIRTLGLSNIVFLVNKMDAVEYSKERFDDVVAQVGALVKTMRFRDGVVAGYCPVSGFQGVNLLPNTAQESMPWYTGPSVLEHIDQCLPAKRMLQYPLRFVISDVSKQTLVGKIETGVAKVGDTCVIVPSNTKVMIKSMERPGIGPVKEAQAGNTVDVTVSGDLVGVNSGDVLCPPKQRCPVASVFEAHVQFFANLPKVVLPGGKLLLQMQAVSVVATVKRIVKKMDPVSGTWSTAKIIKCLPADSQGVIELELPHAIPLELADDNRALGRFVLRQAEETVGGGLIRSLPTVSNLVSVPAPAAEGTAAE